MFIKTYSGVLQGLEAHVIGVEIDVSKGLPSFGIVGLADKAINESRERITVALRSAEYPLPPKKTLVNLAPAYIKKEGAQLDLAIAAGLMVNLGYVNCADDFLEDFIFLSELSLTAELKPVHGILSIALEAKKHHVKYLIVAKENAAEANLVNLDIDKNSALEGSEEEALEVFFVADLRELKLLITALYKREEKKKTAAAMTNQELELLQQFQAGKANLALKAKCKIKPEKDLQEVMGQSYAKRGLEIAAAGRHHLLMIGPPGCGKSMLARRFQDLLPPLNLEQALETTKIYSVSGLLRETLMRTAPFRTPHHSTTAVSLIGGGNPIRPGEIGLAHNGILFLDELTEFNRFVIEQLRQVLDEKEIILNKSNNRFIYPADFTLIAACNPCPCGYLGDKLKSCTCSPSQVSKYISKLSGPFLDRIDIQLQLQRPSRDEIAQISLNKKPRINKTSNTESIRNKVKSAREFAVQMQGKLEKEASTEVQNFLYEAIDKLDLSARSYKKILSVGRTIANLEQSEEIKIEHIAEAVQYRTVNWDDYNLRLANCA